MVGEFPELQGHMGRAYALAAGRAASQSPTPSAITTSRSARRTTWRPTTSRRRSRSPTASTRSPAASPWASRRPARPIPFALRRACIGVAPHAPRPRLRALVFSEPSGIAYDGLRGQEARPRAARDRRQGRGVRDRAPARASSRRRRARSSPTPCSPARPRRRCGTRWPSLARARALQAVVDAKQPWLDKAKMVAKRLAGSAARRSRSLHPADGVRGQRQARTTRRSRSWSSDLDAGGRSLTTEQAVRGALMSDGAASRPSSTASSSRRSSTTRRTPSPRSASRRWRTGRSRCSRSPISRSSGEAASPLPRRLTASPCSPIFSCDRRGPTAAPTGGPRAATLPARKDPPRHRHACRHRLRRIDHHRREPHRGRGLSRKREDRHLRRHERRSPLDLRHPRSSEARARSGSTAPRRTSSNQAIS